MTGSHARGQEIYNRAVKLDKTAFLYRGLMHNADGEFPHESPCIKPSVLDDLRKKGANPYLHGCAGCDVKALCESAGLRSQWKHLSDPDTLLILAMPQLFIDPIFRQFLKNRVKLTIDDMILVDDASTEALFLNENVSLERLQRLSRRWKGKPTGDFALKLIEAVSACEGDAMIEQVQSIVNDVLKDSQIRPVVYRQLRKANINGTEVGLDDAISNGHYPIGTDAERARLPEVDKLGWTLLDKLRIFFSSYPDPSTAPMKFYEGQLSFSLPPQLYKTPAALGFMGATLDKDVFQQVFRKGTRYLKGLPEFYDAATTEWDPDAKVFQLRTNRNPRATLLNKETRELSKTGKEYFDYFKQSLETNTGSRHALISYKTVVENRADALADVAMSWFHNSEGLDTRFQGCEVFHILGMPGRTPQDTEWVSRQWQVSEDIVREKLVTSELLQAVGRARLVRNPATVIIWTSHFIPGITDREQTTLFDETDWQKADGDIEKLQAIVAEREAAEQSGDVQEYVEATGQSQRTAYQQTQEARKQTKAERDSEIRRRANTGETQQQIADALGINKSTVSRLLNL